MFEIFREIITDWRNIVYPIAFMISIPYLASLLSRYLNDRFGSSIDEEHLALVTARMNCSTYTVFCVSGARWNVTKETIDGDFKKYLHHLKIPYYVRDFTSHVIEKDESTDIVS
jgi:hypothetical protein